MKQVKEWFLTKFDDLIEEVSTSTFTELTDKTVNKVIEGVDKLYDLPTNLTIKAREYQKKSKEEMSILDKMSMGIKTGVNPFDDDKDD